MFGALRSFASTLMQPVGQTFGSAPEPPAPELAAEYQIQQRRVVLDADYRIDYVWWELRDRNAGRLARLATCRRSRAPYRPKSARYLPAPAQ